MPEYYHVRLAISQYGEQFRAELFTEDLGDTDGDLLKADWDELLGKLGPAPTEDDARAVGREMFAQMLGLGRNRGKWTAVVAQARDQGKPLRLLVDATTDAVRDLPFGLLRDDEPEHYLFRGAAPGGEAIQFVRILRRCPPKLLHLDPPGPTGRSGSCWRLRSRLRRVLPSSPSMPRSSFVSWHGSCRRSWTCSFVRQAAAPQCGCVRRSPGRQNNGNPQRSGRSAGRRGKASGRRWRQGSSTFCT